MLLLEIGEGIEKNVLVASIIEAEYAGRDKAKDEIILNDPKRGVCSTPPRPKNKSRMSIDNCP
jgi:hypothetical protein